MCQMSDQYHFHKERMSYYVKTPVASTPLLASLVRGTKTWWEESTMCTLGNEKGSICFLCLKIPVVRVESLSVYFGFILNFRFYFLIPFSFVTFLMSNWILLFLTNLIFIQSLCPLRLYPSSLLLDFEVLLFLWVLKLLKSPAFCTVVVDLFVVFKNLWKRQWGHSTSQDTSV